jgi:hypothetical protein
LASGNVIIVEIAERGGFRVVIRPIFSRPAMEREFPFAGDALDYAELVAGEIGASVIDQTRGEAACIHPGSRTAPQSCGRPAIDREQ